MKRFISMSAAAMLMAGSSLAQLPDAPPVDVGKVLEALKEIREVNESGIRAKRNAAYQQVAAAVASTERAVAYWKDAVKTVQFQGAEKEGSQVRDWREADGAALNDRLCANAVRLHLNWLAIHLQHAAGTEMKDLLPKVLEHVNAAQAAVLAGEQFNESLEKAKDRGPTSPGARRNVQDDAMVKRVHDGLMRMPISNSPVARLLQLQDMFGDNRRKTAGSWELIAFNVDGIYNSVVLPEYRATKDPRLLEYWDMVLKRETERTAARKLDIEQRDFNQVKRPRILWSRAQDVLTLGMRNRAIGEMLNIVKTYPQHPEAPNWISQLEEVLKPAVISEGEKEAAPTAPSLPPPAAIPAATGAAGVVPSAGAGLLVR